MTLITASNATELIGRTEVVRIKSLSELSGCEILLKCENFNPGGSVKDRAALQMVQDAISEGKLRDGMTIVEGTAGNTGIGLAFVGSALGFEVLVVMPSGQAIEKEKQVSLFGADLKTVAPCPFKNPNHFYHTARNISEENPDKYWWANQFDNLSNYKAHFTRTGPEILAQTDGKLDFFVSVAGTGGTISGVSRFLKEKSPNTKIILVDPEGSGYCSYVHTGEYKSKGNSITEGIGIMRLVDNFNQAKIDDAFTLPDQDLVTIAQYIRKNDGLVVGSSSALNIAGALKVAAVNSPGKKILTMICDGGERSMSKLFNPDFLREKDLDPDNLDVIGLIEKYKSSKAF